MLHAMRLGEVTIRQGQAAQSWVLKSRLFILQFKFADFGV